MPAKCTRFVSFQQRTNTLCLAIASSSIALTTEDFLDGKWNLSEKPFFTQRPCTSQNLSTTYYYIKIEFVSICPHVENSQGVLTEEVICAVPENI